MSRTFLAQDHCDFYREPLGRQVLEAEVAMLLDLLPERGRALSIGCGIGAHEAELQARRPALEVLCLDIDEGMLAEVPAALPRVRADMRALPVAPGAFAAAYMMTSLGFTPDPGRVVEEAACVLAPGGMLLVMAINPTSRWGEERFRGEGPTWGDLDRLAGMVSRATGAPTEVSHDLWIRGDGLVPAGRPEDAALLVLRSEKA